MTTKLEITRVNYKFNEFDPNIIPKTQQVFDKGFLKT